MYMQEFDLTGLQPCATNNTGATISIETCSFCAVMIAATTAVVYKARKLTGANFPVETVGPVFLLLGSPR